MPVDRGSGSPRVEARDGAGSEAIALPIASQEIINALNAGAIFGEDPGSGILVAMLQFALPPLVPGGRDYLAQLVEYFKRLAPAIGRGAVALVPDEDLRIWLNNRVDVDDIPFARKKLRMAAAHVREIRDLLDALEIENEQLLRFLTVVSDCIADARQFLEGSPPIDLELPELQFRADGKILRGDQVVGEDMRVADIAAVVQLLDSARRGLVTPADAIDRAMKRLDGDEILAELAAFGERDDDRPTSAALTLLGPNGQPLRRGSLQ